MSKSIDTVLVTSRNLPDLPEHDRPLIASLVKLGLSHLIVPWDDTDFDWNFARLALLKSTWDYPQRCEEFLCWLEFIEGCTELVNPPDIVRWNISKSPRTLWERGAPILPTRWCTPTKPVPSASELDALAAERLIIKSAVGGSATELTIYDSRLRQDSETATR